MMHNIYRNRVSQILCKIYISVRVRPHYARFLIRDSSKLAFFIHIRLANNANGHIRRICTRRLIFVSIC